MLYRTLQELLSYLNISIIKKSTLQFILGYPERIHEQVLRNSSGVLHIGGHLAEERFKYQELGVPVVWIEGIEDYYKKLVDLIATFPKQSALNFFLSDQNSKDVPFFLSNNDRSSSSLFKLSDTKNFPGLRMDGEMMIHTHRLDEVVDDGFIRRHNHVVIDVQGAELKVLIGFGDLLYSVKSLNIEISTYEVYRDGATFVEIESYLSEFGFFPLWVPIGRSHSDVIFIKHN